MMKAYGIVIFDLHCPHDFSTKFSMMPFPRVVRLSDEEIPFQKNAKLPPRKTWKVVI